MTNVSPLRGLRAGGVTLLLAVVALGTVHGVAAQSPSTSAAAHMQRLAQNVERAESVGAVKRLQETYAQYSQFGLWTDMSALFAVNAQLSYGTDNARGGQAIQDYRHRRHDRLARHPADVVPLHEPGQRTHS